MLSLDHPSVREVIRIAEELVSENKILNAQKIYKRAKRELKLPRKGLLRIIQFLIDRRILVEGSKFTKESVLNNTSRRRIFEIINIEIGIHFSDLKKRFGLEKMGNGQFTWHLEMLIKFNYIKKISFKNYVIFIPIDLDDKHGILYFILRDKIKKKILFFFSDKECVEKSVIYANLKEKRETIYYHINELERVGIILFKHDKLICISKKCKKILIEIIS